MSKVKQRIQEEEGADIESVLRDYAEMGYSRNFVAGLLKVSDTTVYRWAKEYGVTFKEYAGSGGIKGILPANTKAVTWNGITRSQKAWARHLGISDNAFRKRLKRLGLCEKTFSMDNWPNRGNKSAVAPKVTNNHPWVNKRRAPELTVEEVE